MKKLLAKSESKGLLWLEEHTMHVLNAIEHFARAFNMDTEVARHGAILHDLGKGHPTFQAMLIFKPYNRREHWLAQLAGAPAIRRQLLA